MLYDNSVINSNFKDIRGVCREAQKYNIETDKHLYTLKTELYAPPTIITYLSEDELKQIVDLRNLPEYLDNVRDWLIISCYTGQRVSDFMRFTPDMIDRKNNRSLIHITQQKTGKKVAIPLLPIVENILKKRNGNFPKPISDQKYNDYIKEVCRKAKINDPIKGKITTVTDVGTRREAGIYPKWQLISSHVGRRSFATNFYGKIPTPYIKDITGHGTEAMLLKYIGKKSDDTAREAYDLMLKLK